MHNNLLIINNTVKLIQGIKMFSWKLSRPRLSILIQNARSSDSDKFRSFPLSATINNIPNYSSCSANNDHKTVLHSLKF